MNRTPHPIDSRPLINDQIVMVDNKRYLVEWWQGMNPYYRFRCIEEDAGPSFTKSYDQVKFLLTSKKMIIL